MFELSSRCTVEIDRKNFNEIFPTATSTTIYFGGSNPDLKELRDNEKLEELAFDSGTYLVQEVIKPLEEGIFNSVCFISVGGV